MHAGSQLLLSVLLRFNLQYLTVDVCIYVHVCVSSVWRLLLELAIIDVHPEPVFSAVPCRWEWGEFSQCSETCGGGTRRRVPIIREPAQHGGSCPLNVRRRVA